MVRNEPNLVAASPGFLEIISISLTISSLIRIEKVLYNINISPRSSSDNRGLLIRPSYYPLKVALYERTDRRYCRK